MPLLPFEDGPMNPFGTPDGAKPEGLIVTRDAFSPPIKEGGPPWSDPMGQPDRARPSFGETLGSSFRLENEVVGGFRAMGEDRDFGDPDPDHNPWDTISGTKYQDYWQHFTNSKNAKETESIRLKLDQELEDRRIREASGATGFLTDMLAAVASPTTLLPGGVIYKGYKAGYMTLRSAASVGAMAAASVTAQELMLQQQQLTRTWQESMLNIAGGTLLGGLLGGGISHFSTAALRRASAQVDAHIASIDAERAGFDFQSRLSALETKARENVLTPAERAELEALRNEPPFGQPAGAAVSRPLQENVPEGAFGLDRVFAFQGPMPRVMAGTIKTARDVMTRLAEMTGPLRQNREGIATGPAGGSVELRIKVDGDLAIYRAQEGLYKNFAEYRFGARDAPLARSRAAFTDMVKSKPGVMDWRTFKSEVTRALREQTEKGIEHPVPQVKAAAEAIRKEVFEPFKKEAIKLGLFPKEAEFDWNYVMRRWDVAAILNDYPRFKQILLDHLRGGQAKAASELAQIEQQIDALRRSGDLVPEVESLRRQLEAERARFAVDEGQVDALLDMWRLVVKDKPKKPMSLVTWIKRNGGLRDEGSALAHMLGSKREAGRLINRRGMALDDAGLRAFENGYFSERPTISELLDAIDEDVRGGGVRFSDADAEAVETWRIAQEFREEIARLGLDDVKSEKRARRMITQALREEARKPESGLADDAAFIDELTRMDNLTPEQRAAVDAERLDAETRAADEEEARRRGGINGDDLDPLLATAVPTSFVRRIVESGRTYRFADETIQQNMEAAAPYASAMPAGVRLGTWSSVGPSRRGDDWVLAGFRTLTGDIAYDIPRDLAFGLRAGYLPDIDLVVTNGIGERLGSEGHVASGIYHEAVHAHLSRLDDAAIVDLVSHADHLRVLDMQFGTFLRIIGHPTWEHAPNVTLREKYLDMYDAFPQHQARILAEESVTHMQELHYMGFFSDADVAPVLQKLLAMRGGAPSRMEGTGGLDMPLGAAGVDRSTGQSMARSLDNLGYYSGALEAVKRWGQAKGTPEQFLAHLKKSGVKDAEIETLELKARIEGLDTVTKRDMLDYIGENREELRESVTSKATPAQIEAAKAREADIERQLDELENAGRAFADETGRYTPEYQRLIDELDEAREQADVTSAGTGYHDYSLDPDNPTYREAVLHLPEERYGNLGVEGHFPEPNVIGHMMTSLTTKGNARVFTIDQIQSDWGQRIRDHGARDEAKTAKLATERVDAEKRARDALVTVNEFLPKSERYYLYDRIGTHDVDYVSELVDAHVASPSLMARLTPGRAARVQAAKQAVAELRTAVVEASRIRAEQRTAWMTAAPHPLVSSTDQWVNTTLRRAIRQAAEADAEYIAIPTGDTVLSYNPGDTRGMREFYGAKGAKPEDIEALRAEVDRARGSYEQVPFGEVDRYRTLAERLIIMEKRDADHPGIVPKNLRNILQKIDKDVAPEFVETLDSPSGKIGLGHGFTLFPLTEKVKLSVLSDGLPMFAVHGGETEAPRVQLDPRLVASAQQLAERLGVKLPDAADLDIDQLMASLARGIDQMMGRAQRTAKASAEDVSDLISKSSELRKFADASEQELSDIVEGTIAKLTGSPAARGVNPYDAIMKEGVSGPLHARTLKIPDAKVIDFLDDDIERVALQYVRSMAPDVAIAREFGDLNLTEDIWRIQDEIQRRIDQAPNAAERRRIDREGKKTINDIRAIVARLRGTLNQSHNPTSWGPRTAAMVKQANVLRLMGSVLAASIADLPKMLFVHGFRHNADLLATLVTDFQGLRMAKAEAKEMAAGLEFVLSRSGQMWDAFDDLAGHTMPERAMRYMTNKMGRLNLMDAWNGTLKQLSGAMTANRVLRASVDLTNGRISPRDLRRLAASGIDADLARVIAEQYGKHGSVHGRLFLANTNAWDDTPAVDMAKRALMGAVRREADITITTPGQERPIWTSTHLGSVIGQFRTFQLVSIQRTLIAGLQEMDAAKLVALSGMIALGMLSEQLKIVIHGKENKSTPKDMGEWLYAGLANSGALGWLMDADQSLHKISGGNVSMARQVFGNERPISRFASQNAVGALLGPTFGAATDVGRVVGAGLSGKGVTEGDIHAMRRLMFYQNLFYLSRPLRAFEEGMIDAWGVPRQQQRN